MIELTQFNDCHSDSPDGYLSLTIEKRIKSRQKVQLDDGSEAGLFVPRGYTLRDGMQLKSECGKVVEIKAAPEPVSTIYCEDALLLARMAYHLGNRHVPLQVTADWLRYQHDHVLDDMVEGLGGTVTSEFAPFEPEDGAYGGTSGGHHHHH
ncbi:urease accessory protein UreE [Vibrio nigripulchritudo ATCC 27043]|uniref:Urease accessory protein UreE n=1 Tax=Vibrio nigripulchritudo TaxID=28173 RepID=U4K523_9VIBR|nr:MULTISPECIES: urease accessory protein UreE [Vibrio]EGU56821.1 urease accessory protein UreE [Vibrio nigripulchritudo ATCC 27043]UAB73775.1 urease accessory protein UreE [Vibrio sp. SCSIO 43132]CCN80815.1 Urease accessory protein ureE [Vibrio nigripulchritudo BLFn1]CCN88069.1 Urease accessory protein ureE [Vibrio nigripulchritudo SFn27]CCN96923.1 Urease accessory protein ureE [Vibrio nigripulchritudo ENn2]